MAIEFNDSEYRYEDGCAPKGYGYWGFAYEGYEFWTTGTYTEAKKACRKDVKEHAPKDYHGYVEVKVLP